MPEPSAPPAHSSAPFTRDFLSRKPYSDFHARLIQSLEPLTTWPAPEQYDGLARRVPQPADVQLPRFVTERRDQVRRCGGYEQHVARHLAVPTRPGSLHDFFNMTVWAHFPKLRWALNSLHVDPRIGPKDPRNGRAPAQNLAASFDEAGMLVLSTSRDLLEELRALRFKRAFWERREELLETTRFWIVGHGLLESLLSPHPGLAARSLLLFMPSLPAPAASDELRFQIDRLAAARVDSWRATREVLDPIPVRAIPGYSDNDSVHFYEDFRNIRFEPISRRPSALDLPEPMAR